MSRGEELLADIAARAEWAYVDAFDAEDAPPLDSRTRPRLRPTHGQACASSSILRCSYYVSRTPPT